MCAGGMRIAQLWQALSGTVQLFFEGLGFKCDRIFVALPAVDPIPHVPCAAEPLLAMRPHLTYHFPSSCFRLSHYLLCAVHLQSTPSHPSHPSPMLQSHCLQRTLTSHAPPPVVSEPLLAVRPSIPCHPSIPRLPALVLCALTCRSCLRCCFANSLSDSASCCSTKQQASPG